MAFSLETNISSILAQNNLRLNGNLQSQAIQRLTSGFRINRSGDDPAGLVLANQFRRDTAELSQGMSNANNGISALQIVDGGMSNISTMLDRLRTLASQSASDLSGDRQVLDSEYQTLLAEINRQAQSIGLDRFGQLARTLSVRTGGGASSGSASDGVVTVDLSASTVDTQSLGLGDPTSKGMEAVGGSAFIGPGSTDHTVAQIVADPVNLAAISNGVTAFYFAGPGFSGANKIKVSVDLQGATDISTLATFINAQIQMAGAGNNPAAATFQKAGIQAYVRNGGQLAFTSSTRPFQVEAGDQMANALLGHLSGTTGTPLTTTVAGETTADPGSFIPTGVTVRINGGGMNGPVDITFDSSQNTVDKAIGSLVSQVSSNSRLQAAGISVDGGPAGAGALTFTNHKGEAFTVQATGDTANALGLGTFLAGGGNEPDYSSITGTRNYDDTTAYGNATLEFSIGGAASDGALTTVTVNLDAGDAIPATIAATADSDQSGNCITFQLDGGTATAGVTLGANAIESAALIRADTAASNLVSASVSSGGNLVIVSKTKGAHTLTIGGTTTLDGLKGSAQGAARSNGDLQDALNGAIAASTTLQKADLQATVNAGGSIAVTSTNSTFFRINPDASTPFADIGFGVDGVPFGSNLAVAGAAQTAIDSNGVTNIVPLAFAAMSYGSDQQSLTISTDDSAGAPVATTITLRNDDQGRQGRNIDEAIAYINAQLQHNTTLQKMVAVKENVGGEERINFLSSLPSFTVAVGNSVNAHGLNGGVATSLNSYLSGAGKTSIDTKDKAVLAVNAIVAAVGALGTAQAVVGKGENQLKYAIDLSQSQISNFSAAESRIRDADVAAEAANLTKAQIVQQATIAAMAQANSAPQAVLTLLKG